jgi:cell division topological specificity factor
MKLRKSSKTVAAGRLKTIFDKHKKCLDDDMMLELRREIGEVVAKFIDVEPENIEVRVTLKDIKDAKTIQTKEL